MSRLSLLLMLLFAVMTDGVPVLAAPPDTVHQPDARVSFRNDVMAVLSKSGCNLGLCHGNKFGKGGFRLSLRGQSPNEDWLALTRDVNGRRTNVIAPERSLILRKPTMDVAHEGGRRFTIDSPEYAILRDWIAAGMPADDDTVPDLVRLAVTPREVILHAPEDQVELSVTAEFSDGTRRDVTRLAVYESAADVADVTADGIVQRRKYGQTTVVVRYLDQQLPVRIAFVPARPDYRWTGPEPANFIDRLVFERLRSLRIAASPVASDTVFLRRAYLDLLGVLPTAEEARAFVADSRADKKARLIDALLQRSEYAAHWALKWSDLLRNEEKSLDRKGVQHFHTWIRHHLAADRPLDEFVRELVSARGSTYQNPPANYYRALRDPLTRAEATAQVFLGIRLQCAKCHNHPFDRWTQNDYYGWANLFARVQYKVLDNDRRDRLDKHEFIGEQIVYVAGEGEVTNPASGQPMPPRALGEPEGTLPDGEDRLRYLAGWLTSSTNRRFAEMQANRVWYHLMGRGIVEPIDDFRATNPPSNPELLSALADELVRGGYRLKPLIRTIMLSRTYQLSSVPEPTNIEDDRNFSHARIQRLTAEQMLDATSQALGAAAEFNGYPVGLRAAQLPGVRAFRPRDRRPTPAEQFLRAFGKPERLQTCECERSDETTLNQSFQMISGPLMNDLLSRTDNRLARLLEQDLSDAEIVEEIYWSALTRPPTDQERKRATNHLVVATDRRRAVEDIAWAVLNSHEFLLRR